MRSRPIWARASSSSLIGYAQWTLARRPPSAGSRVDRCANRAAVATRLTLSESIARGNQTWALQGLILSVPARSGCRHWSGSATPSLRAGNPLTQCPIIRPTRRPNDQGRIFQAQRLEPGREPAILTHLQVARRLKSSKGQAHRALARPEVKDSRQQVHKEWELAQQAHHRLKTSPLICLISLPRPSLPTRHSSIIHCPTGFSLGILIQELLVARQVLFHNDHLTP